jgi:hypothetical protein
LHGGKIGRKSCAGKAEVLSVPNLEITAEAIREQLDLIVQDHAFRTSKRSVQFLGYVVEQTLCGAAEQIKERTIGVDVFGRDPSYDTAADHVVRTAAIELRKRLAVYYNDERHRSELRITFVHGSYIPHFALPSSPEQVVNLPALTADHEQGAVEPVLSGAPAKSTHWRVILGVGCVVLAAILALLGYRWLQRGDAEYLFWRPILETPGSVLLAVGDIPNGPPYNSSNDGSQPVPLISKALAANVPYADTVTIARVLSALQAQGKAVVIRPETTVSFSDFLDSPAVLIGAFNNEWSLRLTHQLRFSLALDPDRHLIYIRDSKDPSSRNWSQLTADTIEQQLSQAGPTHRDFALISRIWNAETGHVIVVIGGLYAYGTEAAGKFVTDPRMMRTIAQQVPLSNPRINVQIVLETTVTDGTPGIAKVLAVDTQ